MMEKIPETAAVVPKTLRLFVSGKPMKMKPAGTISPAAAAAK
jgi:hypothetical protein